MSIMKPEPFLLAQQSYHVDLHEAPTDFMRRITALRLGAKVELIDEPAPLIIFTRSSDREADAVGLACIQAGYNYLRFDADYIDDADEQASICIDPDQPGLEAVVRECYSVPNPVTWIRHFDADALGCTRPLNRRFHLYLRDQWRSALDLVADCSHDCINPPAQTRCLDRVQQLRLAHKVGFSIPDSLVTNDVRRVSQLLSSSPSGLIAKPLGHHLLETTPRVLDGLFPRRLCHDDALTLERLPHMEAAPALYQVYIPANLELRIHTVGDDLYAYSVIKNSPDALWTDPRSVCISAVDVPPELRAGIRKYLRHTGLKLAGFDFLLPDTGPPVFLEVNTAGDWCYFERQASTNDVTEAVANYFLSRCKETIRHWRLS